MVARRAIVGLLALATLSAGVRVNKRAGDFLAVRGGEVVRQANEVAAEQDTRQSTQLAADRINGAIAEQLLLQQDAEARKEQGQGIFGAIGGAIGQAASRAVGALTTDQGPYRGIVNGKNGAAQAVGRANTECVMCQYLVQKVQASVIRAAGGRAFIGGGGSVYLEEKATSEVGTSSAAPRSGSDQLHPDAPYTHDDFLALLDVLSGAAGAGAVPPSIESLQAAREHAEEMASELEAAADAGRRLLEDREGKEGASAQERNKGIFDSAVANGVSSAKGALGLKFKPRRERVAEAKSGEGANQRYAPNQPRYPSANDEAVRRQWQMLMVSAANELQNICALRMPSPFYRDTCQTVLNNFRVLDSGLRYGDKPYQICMTDPLTLCGVSSYYILGPHAKVADPYFGLVSGALAASGLSKLG